MTKFVFLIAFTFMASLGHADQDRFKLTDSETAKLKTISDNPQVLKCAIFYYFDGFLDSLGVGINLDKPDPKESEDDAEFRKFTQLRAFLNSGKLELRPASARPNTSLTLTKELARNCHLIATTVMEVQALQIRMMQENSSPASDTPSEPAPKKPGHDI